MKELEIRPQEAGQRLDRYLQRLLAGSSRGFVYKMLRKKNIILNGKKAAGSEILNEGDTIRIYFSDETYDKLTAPARRGASCAAAKKADRGPAPKIIYEDDQLLVLDKPAGMLSQKAKPGDYSVNDFVIGYLLENGQITKEELAAFRPSICNRLDRNTSGLLLAGKTTQGLQQINAALRERTIQKYYHCIVLGMITEDAHLCGRLTKDSRSNRVAVLPADTEMDQKEPQGKTARIETAYHPLWTNGMLTLLEVHLITGRSHQIRAHLASIGHPILGDPKYGDPDANRKYRQSVQLLHACRMELPDGRTFEARDPKPFQTIIGEYYEYLYHAPR